MVPRTMKHLSLHDVTENTTHVKAPSKSTKKPQEFVKVTWPSRKRTMLNCNKIVKINNNWKEAKQPFDPLYNLTSCERKPFLFNYTYANGNIQCTHPPMPRKRHWTHFGIHEIAPSNFCLFKDVCLEDIGHRYFHPAVVPYFVPAHLIRFNLNCLDANYDQAVFQYRKILKKDDYHWFSHTKHPIPFVMHQNYDNAYHQVYDVGLNEYIKGCALGYNSTPHMFEMGDFAKKSQWIQGVFEKDKFHRLVVPAGKKGICFKQLYLGAICETYPLFPMDQPPVMTDFQRHIVNTYHDRIRGRPMECSRKDIEKKILFVTRENATTRRLANLAEIKQYFTNWTYREYTIEFYEPGKYGISGEMKYFEGYEILIAAHGSGSTWLSGMCPGTSYIELNVESDRWRSKYFESLTYLNGMDYYEYIVGPNFDGDHFNGNVDSRCLESKIMDILDGKFSNVKH